ncbi:hypothetical protein ACFQMM_15995 [Saliphagus sp. GCM10025308]
MCGSRESPGFLPRPPNRYIPLEATPFALLPSPPEIAAIVLVPVLAVTVLASLVSLDAAKNGLENPAKWFAVVLDSAGFGVVFSVLKWADSTRDEAFRDRTRFRAARRTGIRCRNARG